ncbi:MAG TPA: TetR/AcrR family transcriptional regulator [Spirochaetota bacterium]|nr:TetR/AcrR family transcriptional regulator [Spirochaetota bacterium]
MISKKLYTKERLLESVKILLEKKGLRGWNMENLAETVGITKRTLYKNIKDKESLIEEVLFERIDTNQRIFLETISLNENYKSRLLKIVRLIPKTIFIDSELYKEIFIEYPSIEQKVLEKRDFFYCRFKDFIKEGQEKGVILSNIDGLEIVSWIQAIIIQGLKTGKENSVEKGILTILRGIMISENQSEVL